MNPADQRAYFFKIDTTMKRIRQLIQKKFDETALNITVDQWVLIDHIYRYEGLSQIELAEMTVKDGPTVTRIIDLLHKKGLAERRMAENDRRKFNIYLTDEGKTIFQKALPIVVEVRRLGWKNLNDEEFQAFVRILDVIYQNVSDEA